METEQCNDKQITFEHSTQRSRIHERWIAEQITILAEAFGESLSPERLRVYTGDLADLGRAQLEIAFTQARHKLKFFPKIAELRELAGAKAEDADQVEADEAWQFANAYLERHGVVQYDGDDRPPLPARIEYALRRIGGLWGLNQITKESRPFMYRDFCEGYRQAPLADVLAPQLAEMFGAVKLLGRMKLLDDPSIAGLLVDRRKELTTRGDVLERPPAETTPKLPMFRAKPIPTPLTEAQIRDRRKMLRQQAARFRNTDTSSRAAEISTTPLVEYQKGNVHDALHNLKHNLNYAFVHHHSEANIAREGAAAYSEPAPGAPVDAHAGRCALSRHRCQGDPATDRLRAIALRATKGGEQ